MKKLSLPSFQFALLFPVIFLTTCSASLPILSTSLEPLWIREATEKDANLFPYLALSSEGKYVATNHKNLTADGAIVTTVKKEDEAKINRDLNDSIGSTRTHYSYFKILAQDRNSTEVSLEIPTFKDSRIKDWYTIKQGSVVPTKIMTLGPGFAFVVLPLSIIVGSISCAIYCVLVKRRP